MVTEQIGTFKILKPAVLEQGKSELNWQRLIMVKDRCIYMSQAADRRGAMRQTLRKDASRRWRSELPPMRTFSYMKFRSLQLPLPLSGPNMGCVHRMSTCKVGGRSLQSTMTTNNDDFK